jgi:hypothetical protein
MLLSPGFGKHPGLTGWSSSGSRICPGRRLETWVTRNNYFRVDHDGDSYKQINMSGKCCYTPDPVQSLYLPSIESYLPIKPLFRPSESAIGIF